MVTRRRLLLLMRYFGGKCTKKEKLSVQAWLESSNRNRLTFESLRRIWEFSAEKGKSLWDPKHSMIGLRLKLKDADTQAGSHDDKLRLYRVIAHPELGRAHRLSLVAQLAALVILSAGIGYLASYLKILTSEKKKDPVNQVVSFQEIATKPGQRTTLSFRDGTRIELNSASNLKYAEYPDGSRQFYLQGEAYFNVVHSIRHPLLVHTSFATIKDIGTKFDVKAWPDDRRNQIAVTKGAVLVHSANTAGSNSALVASGQVTTINSKGIILSPKYVNVNRIISWTSGKLVFFNDAMRDVIRQLRRRYGVNCLLGDNSIGSMTLTATFDEKESIKEVLDIIALSLKLRYKTSNDSVLFVHPVTKPS